MGRVLGMLPEEDDLRYIFEGHRLSQQEKKAKNLAWSTQKLTEMGVDFISHNNGQHLFVEGKYDFYPSTGLFVERGTSNKGRGIRCLLRKLGYEVEF